MLSELKIKNEKLKMASLEVLIISILMISGISSAQSVDSLVNEALQNNPQLKSIEQKIYAGEYRAEAVNNLPPPTLGIEFTQVPIDKINIWDDAISNSLSISQMFPLGGKLSAMNSVELQNVKVTKKDYDSYKTNLTAQVKMSYYYIWQLDRKIEIQLENINLLNNLSNSLEISYQVNRINQADVLTIRSEVSSNNAQLIILKKQREAEIYKLNKLLGRKLDSKELTIDEEINDDTLSYSQTQLEAILSNKNPSLLKMNSMIEMNKAMVNANNSELVPDLMVEGMVMRMPRGMILTSKTDLSMLAHEPQETEYMYSLMASITLPFVPWSSGTYNNKEEELLSEIKGIEYEKNNMQREMTAQLKEALVKYNSAKELMNLYDQEVIPLYTSSAESQTTSYQNGKTSITAVIDSYRMLLMQKMNYYMSKADVQMSLAEVEMMVGADLKNLLIIEGN
ncbi:MAG: TolC family protein [Ignavibacterium sp.]|jgi:outer membrane protein TolC|nr:TolC family protein [Ignavibacterium sp.]